MGMRKSVLPAALVMLWIGAGIMENAYSEGDPDIHYVPTPQYVVEEMLELAGTNKNDIVYDLGCGDGRFVITAVKKFGAAKGVGIDIDPERIRESQENARRAGVTDRVKFYEKNLFETDVHEATVVALYLLPELNVRLRPRLFEQLKPGTRVVSHDFDMADWEPDESGSLGESDYYLWIMPAQVGGKWRVSAPPFGRDGSYEFQITQRYQEIKITMISDVAGVTLSDARLQGDRISFLLIREVNESKVGMHFKGQVKGNTIAGKVLVEGGLFEGSNDWTARHYEFTEEASHD